MRTAISLPRHLISIAIRKHIALFARNVSVQQFRVPDVMTKREIIMNVDNAMRVLMHDSLSSVQGAARVSRMANRR